MKGLAKRHLGPGEGASRGSLGDIERLLGGLKGFARGH